MRRVLRGKNVPQKVWDRVLADPFAFVDLDEFLDRVTEARQRVRNLPPFLQAWSGGKDSLALDALDALVCEVGLAESPRVYTKGAPGMEVPETEAFLAEHLPKNCYVEDSTLTMAWVASNPRRLFPANIISDPKGKHCLPACHSEWNSRKWADQSRVAKNLGLGVVITGRRNADGNWVGRDGETRQKRGNLRTVNPLYDWSHEMVLAYLHDRGVQLPALYTLPPGFKYGVRPWALYPLDTVLDCWPSIIDEHRDWINEGLTRQLEAGYKLRKEKV